MQSFDVVRRLAAVALVAWGGWMLLFGRVADVCRDEVADSKVVQVCEPIALTDPRLVWVVLAVLLLLLPDVSELELAGVLSLKRAVAQVEGQAEQLRGEAHKLRLMTTQLNQQRVEQGQGQGQGQAVYNIFPQDLGPKLTSFLDDVASNDTTAMTEDEELGGYTSLVISSALTGMLNEVFAAWSGRVNLIGWVRLEDGTYEPWYLVATVNGDIAALAQTHVTDGDPFGDLLVTVGDDVVVVTAFTATPGAGPATLRVLGALSVLVESDEEPTEEELEDLGAKAEAAAGAYGLLLLRVLGGPSTLGSSAGGEQS